MKIELRCENSECGPEPDRNSSAHAMGVHRGYPPARRTWTVEVGASRYEDGSLHLAIHELALRCPRCGQPARHGTVEIDVHEPRGVA